MKNLSRTALCLMLVFLAWGRVLAQEGALPAEEGDHREIEIKTPVELKVHVPGGSVVALPALSTTLPDEFLVPASHPAMEALTRTYGASLKVEGATVTCRRGPEVQKLASGQTRFPDTPQGRLLEVPPQLRDGQVYLPVSLLEDLLGARFTVQGSQAWLEPLIRNVRVEGEAPGLKLVMDSSLPLSFKTFRLKQPDRYVVDIPGAVLDAGTNRLSHPDLGTIRLGQFELGPAVSRIVIPIDAGVQVRGVSRTPGGLAVACAVPSVARTAPGQNFAGQKITAVTLEPMVGGSRLVLKASGPIQYEWKRYKDPDNRLVLDIPRVALAGPKQEFPVGGEFLQAVRVSQFQPDPAAVVRVVLELKKPAETRLTTGESPNSVVLEVMDRPISGYAPDRGYGATNMPAVGGGIICLDPGHGGSDPGAMNRALGICEADVTLDICLRLADILKKEGWNVVMTRTQDVDVSWAGSSASEELGARVKVAQDYGADLFVSIHCNSSASSRANGTSAHYFKSSDYLLAQEIQPNLISGTGRIDRGCQKNRFYVLAHSRMPAVLLETAFISNSDEGRLLNTPEYRQRVAESVAQGLRQYAARYMNKATASR